MPKAKKTSTRTAKVTTKPRSAPTPARTTAPATPTPAAAATPARVTTPERRAVERQGSPPLKGRIVEAVGTAVTMGGAGTGDVKGGFASRVEQAMAEAGAKAMAEGKSDEEIRQAKLDARARIKREHADSAARDAEEARRTEQDARRQDFVGSSNRRTE